MLSEFSNLTRNSQIEKLNESDWEVVIIGGGISGAGIALESARMGWKTILLEKGDFASGTSSRSSGMIHGGLRYLEFGQFSLVKEALKERYFLCKAAPDIVKPTRFLFPVYKGNRPFWKLKLGIWLYDQLAGKLNLEKREVKNKIQTLDCVPQLNSKGLKGSILFSDCLVRDTELVISVISTAASFGTVALNYIQAEKPIEKSGKWYINWQDKINGKNGYLTGKCIVVCTGVWTDEYLNHRVKRIRPTKGIHFTVPHNKCPIKNSVVLPSSDGRILFANRRDAFLYFGTTDTDYNGNPEDVQVEDEDIQYVLKKVNSLFPNSRLSKTDIHSVWAGLRPLVHDIGNPASISRKEVIEFTKRGYIKVYGGKLTTFRKMALRVSAHIKKTLGKGNCLFKYDSLKLNPVRFNSDNAKDNILNYLKYTMPMTLVDLLNRRMDLARFGADNGRDEMENALEISANKLGWNEHEMATKRSEYLNHIMSFIPGE